MAARARGWRPRRPLLLLLLRSCRSTRPRRRCEREECALCFFHFLVLVLQGGAMTPPLSRFLSLSRSPRHPAPSLGPLYPTRVRSCNISICVRFSGFVLCCAVLKNVLVLLPAIRFTKKTRCRTGRSLRLRRPHWNSNTSHYPPHIAVPGSHGVREERRRGHCKLRSNFFLLPGCGRLPRPVGKENPPHKHMAIYICKICTTPQHP